MEMPFGMTHGLGQTNSVLRGGDHHHRRRGSFGGKHLSDKANTTNNNCELDWSMQRHTTGADAWLQVLDESIIGGEVDGAIAHHWWSVISTIALLCFV